MTEEMRRPLAKWKWAAALATIVVMLFALVLTTTPGHNKEDKEVSVAFLSFTNHPVYGEMAFFIMSNECNRKFIYSVYGTQARSNGAWVSFPGPFVSRDDFILLGEARWVFGVLGPRQSGTVIALVPTESNVWRIMLHCRRIPGEVEQIGFHLTNNWAAIRKGSRLPGFKGRFDPLPEAYFSAEIANGFNPSVPSSFTERR